MSGVIFLLGSDSKLLEMNAKEYASENLLQELLVEYPNLLAGDQINPDQPRRWLLIRREVPIRAGENDQLQMSIDHLFIDQDAIPTLVEVKRSSDSRIRREVIGQMLDYASNAILNWHVEEIQARFEARCEDIGIDPDDELSLFLEEDMNVDEFWSHVKTNLRAGKIRMLFVADEIPVELKRVVEFLNQQMDPAEVLAVEIKQYEGGGLKTLVPRVIGATPDGKAPRPPSRRWDETTYFEDLAKKHDRSSVSVVAEIVSWAKENVTRIFWGSGTTHSNFVPILHHRGKDYRPVIISSSGWVEFVFQYLVDKPPFNEEGKRIELLQKWTSLKGIDLPEDSYNRRPSISLDEFVQQVDITEFVNILDWFVREVKEQ